jgi:hypothetical protein
MNYFSAVFQCPKPHCDQPGIRVTIPFVKKTSPQRFQRWNICCSLEIPQAPLAISVTILFVKKRHRSASKDGREFLQHRNNLPPNTGRTSERLALFVLRQGPSVQSVLMPVMGASFKRQ